jgi:anti-anti-sigma factor
MYERQDPAPGNLCSAQRGVVQQPGLIQLHWIDGPSRAAGALKSDQNNFAERLDGIVIVQAPELQVQLCGLKYLTDLGLNEAFDAGPGGRLEVEENLDRLGSYTNGRQLQAQNNLCDPAHKYLPMLNIVLHDASCCSRYAGWFQAMNLKIQKRLMENAVAVIEIGGRIALGRESGAIEPEVLGAIADGARTVILDLSGVSHIDSTGIGIMAYCFGKAAQKGAEMRIGGAKINVVELFRMTRLVNVIPIFPDVNSAVTGSDRLV